MSSLKPFNEMIASERTQNHLSVVLAGKKETFVSNITALVSNDPNLQDCDPLSIIYAGIKATALGLMLDPNIGLAYVVPYYNSKTKKKEAQLQIGWRGFYQLAMRSGQFQCINVTDVREGEMSDFDLLSGHAKFKALPNRETLPVIGYAAYFLLNNGFSKTLYMTKGEVEAHAKRYSKTYGSEKEYIRDKCLWSTDFDPMARKTVLKVLLKNYGILCAEMQQAVTTDQAVIDQDGNPKYVDNPQYASVEDVTHEVTKEIEATTATEVIDFDPETGEIAQPEPMKANYEAPQETAQPKAMEEPEVPF